MTVSNKICKERGFIMSQIKLVNFQVARILSEWSHNNKPKFRRLTLIAVERKMYEAYCQKDVDTLSDCELVEFQKLYCKKRLTPAINAGKFLITLEFSKELRPEVKKWLKEYGFYLAPDKPIDYDKGWLYEAMHPTPESKTKFELRW